MLSWVGTVSAFDLVYTFNLPLSILLRLSANHTVFVLYCVPHR
jgi:hypothetical protein